MLFVAASCLDHGAGKPHAPISGRPAAPLAQVQLGVDFRALEEPLADLAHD